MRGMVIDVNLDPVQGSETGKVRPCVIVTNDAYNARLPVIQVVPLTAWSEKKAAIITNVPIVPDSQNGLTKRSIADCLQTRPVDHHQRLIKVRGQLDAKSLASIDEALKKVFALK
ncbi:MAG TPA: type II toxin-antitoxin system PemK/MazF family toxin [Caldilinea sp.]|nr:type II toxin-antitoxin system PemK/MazF family toxin [Caldilinea sp.]HRA65083.1 type II toxin-antitoxin system PemK/MazF family toxin [Caldilinea sp.]